MDVCNFVKKVLSILDFAKEYASKSLSTGNPELSIAASDITVGVARILLEELSEDDRVEELLEELEDVVDGLVHAMTVEREYEEVLKAYTIVSKLAQQLGCG